MGPREGFTSFQAKLLDAGTGQHILSNRAVKSEANNAPGSSKNVQVARLPCRRIKFYMFSRFICNRPSQGEDQFSGAAVEHVACSHKGLARRCTCSLSGYCHEQLVNILVSVAGRHHDRLQ